MNKENIEFQIRFNETYLDQADIFNANIDVYITLQDGFILDIETVNKLVNETDNGFSLLVIVGTPRNLQYLMEEEKNNFYGPGLPWIFVQNLTREIIQEAIKVYINDQPDGYWVKLYHFASQIDPAVFNQLQAQEIERQQKCEIKIQQEREFDPLLCKMRTTKQN
tara:strand:+ start:72 stop:566 length:495 start_codon:yes stop_codon:yes gene_type:complete